MKKNKVAIIGLTGQSIFMNIDEFHKNGETKQANNIFIEPGGKGYNQAIACAKLNMDVYYLTVVGNDSYASVCEETMKKYNINTYYIRKEVNTALATIITNSNGDNQVTVYKGANEYLNICDLNKFKPVIEQCDILLAQNEIPYEVLKEAIIFAKEKGLKVIYNPAPAIYDINDIIEYVDVIIPNESEASIIYKDINNIKIDNDLRLIITKGSKGCTFIDKNISKDYSSIKVKSIDTTGAGDVFCSAITSQIVNNKNIDEIINFATIASGLHVRKKYVIDAIPTLEEIEKYKKEL